MELKPTSVASVATRVETVRLGVFLLWCRLWCYINDNCIKAALLKPPSTVTVTLFDYNETSIKTHTHSLLPQTFFSLERHSVIVFSYLSLTTRSCWLCDDNHIFETDWNMTLSGQTAARSSFTLCSLIPDRVVGHVLLTWTEVNWTNQFNTDIIRTACTR